MREVARRTAAAHTWNCPTLVVARALRTDEQLKSYRPGPAAQRAPIWLQPQLEALVILNAFTNEDRRITQAALPRHLRMLELLQEAGAPLLTGTDTPAAGIVPGYSLHDELEMFVQAGLTPFEALQAATVEPARFLDREARSGTVEVGKSADLVLLRANPLADIENIRSLAGVVLRGRWHPIAELEGDGG
jgi:Amidohydrolase family